MSLKCVSCSTVRLLEHATGQIFFCILLEVSSVLAAWMILDKIHCYIYPTHFLQNSTLTIGASCIQGYSQENKTETFVNKNQARRLERCDWLMGSRMGTPTESRHVVPSTRDTLSLCMPSICSHGNHIKDTCEKKSIEENFNLQRRN